METMAFEVKFASADLAVGSFTGYASTFGNVDRGGDVVAPGAFKATLDEIKLNKRPLPMLMQHGMSADTRPVGVWDMVEEDERGLKVAGRLVGLDTEIGKFNYALIKEGAMRGLSIGYGAVSCDYGQREGEPRRILREVKLYEISIVDSPMNLAAGIADVKSARAVDEIKSLAEAEAFLREAGPQFWSKRTACEFVSRVKRIAQGEPVVDDEAAGKRLELLRQVRESRIHINI